MVAISKAFEKGDRELAKKLVGESSDSNEKASDRVDDQDRL